MTETAATPRPVDSVPVAPALGRLVPRASLVLVLAALPVCFLANLPWEGWAVATGLWVVGIALNRWARDIAARGSANAAIGVAAVAMFARMGIAMMTILFTGAAAKVGDSTLGAGQPDVAVTALVLYTLLFTLDMGERIGSDVSTRHTSAAAREEDT